MPSSPKFFHARPAPFSARRSTVLVLFCCLLIGLTGFIFGLVSFLSPIRSYKCLNSEPRSVRVVWEHVGSARGGGGASDGNGGNGKRHKVYNAWKKPLVWLSGLSLVKHRDKSKMLELKREVAEYDDFLLLDIEEEYSKLPYKTLAFFKAAYALYDSEFYVKADDDIYLRPDRLSLLLAKDRSHSQTYLGCMKKGPVFTDPKLKWYEPLGYMLGKEAIVFGCSAMRTVTIGAWMLAMNVNHENDHALCEPDCSPKSVAVWDIPKCSGLCNPEKKLLELHQKELCSKSPTLESDE
ncbi:Hexosyltransferase [Quillaja saponaria]|uniref:Hexosyltransferase n=1 Tax=Quillaja saponaria TaxID=32244 RepID=A0AAD7PAS6_QUISA|nr:Hexosyltransferase [Quillaja saponaria]